MLFKKFIEETGTLSVKARGNIDYWEIIDLYKSIQDDDSLPRKLKILINTTQSKFDFEVKYYEDISKVIEDVIQKYEIIKEAIVVDSPDETDVALMFDDKTVIENFSFKIFTTIKAAQIWLDF